MLFRSNANPYALLTKGYEDVVPSEGAAKVYPLISTQTTFFGHSGTHTAACGVTAYLGDWLGPTFADDLFLCEPTAHLVARWKMERNGASMRGRRDRPGMDFLASSDAWFRPVSLANGPDGALYVVDRKSTRLNSSHSSVSRMPSSA